MVDNEMALTFSVRNNPGVYALLLGSGVSTDAGVPTGWGIVEDLIRKLADAQDKDPDPDPFEWYEEEYEQEPQYDELIEKIAPSKEERQSLLEAYFKPTDEEREEGIKTPSKAHESRLFPVNTSSPGRSASNRGNWGDQRAIAVPGSCPGVYS